MLTKPMIEDAKRLLNLLGLPVVDAPGEAEAQAAYMAPKGFVWALSSRDYDSILFGGPRLVRNLTIVGTEFLPSRGVARPITPELVELEPLLSAPKLSRAQLVDIAILIGTDFNEGVRGIGPKKALTLIRKYGSIEALPKDFKVRVATNYDEVRRLFLNPLVTDDYPRGGEVQVDDLYTFLCEERSFSKGRVKKAVERMILAHSHVVQRNLDRWLT